MSKDPFVFDDSPPPRMYILSLHNPWCDTFFRADIAHPKLLENRSKPPPAAALRTWVAFHSAQKFDHERYPLIAQHAPEISGNPAHHRSGEIRGLAFISGFTDTVFDMRIPIEQRRWFLGPVAYLISHVISFDEPITGVKGQQGWKFLQPEHERQIRETYGARMTNASL